MSELVLREVPIAQTRALRQSVLRPHQTHDELAAHEAAGAFAVGVFAGDELIAVGFVAPEGGPGAWRIRGMATTPGARRRGAGAAVLDALVSHALDNGATRIWCNARDAARAFYARSGFRVVSDGFEVPEIGRHYVMERTSAHASAS